MATTPRTYLMTSKTGLNNIPPKNGQVISIWDNDEVWYDAPDNGNPDGTPVRRKISGVRVVTSLPEAPMTGIAYVYIGDHGTSPSGEPLYDVRIWENGTWYIVATNSDDANVMTKVSDDKFYIVGTDESTDESVGTLLKNTGAYIQSGEIHGTLRGKADDAIHADNADLATRATNDNATTPKAITGYIYGLASDATTNLGSTITITKGDGTTSTIRVSDTKYNVFSSNTAGLVPGTNTQVTSDSTNLLMCGSGWINKDNYVMPAADSASKDGLGQNIANTYIKNLAYNTSTDILTLTYGNDTTATVSIPDTTYSVFTTSANGLVPMASGTGTTGKFLRGDATWQSAITPSDIFAGTAAGLVPASTSGVNEKFLRSDGTWFGTFDNDEDGLVPKTNTAQATDILHANGTWSAETDTKNTAGSTQIDITQAQSPLYLIGAASQAANPQTYSDVKVYAQGNKLYSNNAEVVNLSDSQALTNKTYNGFTLASACELTASASVTNDNTTAPTGSAVIAYVSNRINTVQQAIDTKADQTVIAPVYSTSATYPIDSYVMYDDGDGAKLYKCTTAVTSAQAFDPAKWSTLTVASKLGTELTGTLTAGSTSITFTDSRITTSSTLSYWTSVFGVAPINAVVTTGQVVLTFIAQSANIDVKVEIR